MIKFVETSAPSSDFAKSLKKGIRVVVNMGSTKDPSYWMATVSKNNASKGIVSLNFDDGDVAEYKAIKSKVGIVGIGVDKKRKAEIPLSQLSKWLIVPEATTPSSLPKAKSSPVTLPNGKLTPEFQRFVSDWITEFSVGTQSNNQKLYTQMEKMLPYIPTALKNHIGPMYRGMRLAPADFHKALTGPGFGPKGEFISFTKSIGIAEDFAGNTNYDRKGKPQVGLILSHPAKSIVLYLPAVLHAMDDEDLKSDLKVNVNYEEELIVHNRPTLKFTRSNILGVILNRDLFKGKVPAAKVDALFKLGRKSVFSVDPIFEINEKTMELLQLIN